MYETEFAKDIISVASEEEKKEANQKLEEALRESHEAERASTKAAQDKEDEKIAAREGLGLGGWLGIVLLFVIAAGVATNFGRASNKKLNLNRKRGLFERFWMKLKGS